jgi:peptidoglycan/LPS O-acetylase OafA/YrhL
MQRFLVLDSSRGLCGLPFAFVGSFTEIVFFRESSLFVEFFFVLSSFVLTQGYAFRKNLSFSQFAILRTFRLLPK